MHLWDFSKGQQTFLTIFTGALKSMEAMQVKGFSPFLQTLFRHLFIATLYEKKLVGHIRSSSFFKFKLVYV